MANKLSLGLVIGGTVSPTLGAAFKTVGGDMRKLEAQGAKTKVMQKFIGDTIRLRDEWKKAHDSGSADADKLLKKLDANLSSLKKQGIEVGRLRQEYNSLGKAVRSVELSSKGVGQINAGKDSLRGGIGQAAAATAMVAVPTKVSADFQAIVRDIAIKSGTANTSEEVATSQAIIQTAKDTGMGNADVADLVNQLVGGGMELGEALKYAPVAAKFAVGQGASGTDTAKMILAMQNNAKISDPAKMEQALASVAYMGQEGSFEAADMAKWFPELLAQMASSGITGQEAVTQLGAMLQVQVKSAGSADAAANNLKNWMSKIGSSETLKGYADAGIDYQRSMNVAIASGKSTLEASMELARTYVQKSDPSKAKQMDEGMASIAQEADPAKAQAMVNALGEALRTGDLFADMQVKTALMAYAQNKATYESLKANASDPNGKAQGILDKNLAERRETSTQRWAQAGQAASDSLRAIGDAIRPGTDQLAAGLSSAAHGLASLADESPQLVMGLASVTAGALVLGKALAVIKIGRGLANVARGAVGNKNVQRVFVTNADAGGIGSGLDAGINRSGKGRKAGKFGRLGADSKVLKAGGPLAFLGAGVQAFDTYQNAETRDQKAQGYGSAAGGLSGGLAGAAAGAALGSIVPVVGTAVGGIIGSMLGAWGGGELGASVSKALFGGKDQPAVGQSALPFAQGKGMGDVVRSMNTQRAVELPHGQSLKTSQKPQVPTIDQRFTFAPAPSFTIQGDVKDPAQLVRELMPHLRRQFEEFARDAKSRQLFDAPDAG